MVASIPLTFLVNNIFIYYRCSQIAELCLGLSRDTKSPLALVREIRRRQTVKCIINVKV
jgi:hypothetical protein